MHTAQYNDISTTQRKQVATQWNLHNTMETSHNAINLALRKQATTQWKGFLNAVKIKDKLKAYQPMQKIKKNAK